MGLGRDGIPGDAEVVAELLKGASHQLPPLLALCG